MNNKSDICYTDARLLANYIASGKLSSKEVMSCFLEQIGKYNPQINAICTQIPEQDALNLADQADKAVIRGDKIGSLHGLPIAVKDLSLTKGIRTTFGSLAFADHYPTQDSLLVQRLKNAGAIIIGKTNTPEFGAGSNTFNQVFGVTQNPYDLTKTAGGSSGGAAAALASGMLPIADGSDMGGSLRNPAAFCNVVGFRSSVGRVPSWPNSISWSNRLGVEGPMARNVSDCALLLSAIAGPDPRDPFSIHEKGTQFLQDLETNHKEVRIGWTPDLGILPVAKEVTQICEMALKNFTDAGCLVSAAHPDLTGAMDVFKTLRGAAYAAISNSIPKEKHKLLKATLRENMELGFASSADDINKAEISRTQLTVRFIEYFKKYDFLVLPTTQVKPFDHNIEWVDKIEDSSLTNYIDWMSICCIISLFGLPAISVPCGFTEEGLPIGIQIVGKPRADLDVLKIAYAFETITNFHLKRPSLDA
ncbi:MAG: amidase [Gammaproteobacteria bacterium]|nr:amidase [Gammaproteobacteria bacterium]